MKKKKIALPLFLLTLILTSLACTVFVGGPAYPETTIPYSPEAVQSLQQQIQEAMVTGAETGVVTLQINESQLTSYLILKLQQNGKPPFDEPQVLLRNGEIQVFGKIQRGMFTANMEIVLTATVDENGKQKIDITSADFGPFPAPEGLNNAISSLIDEAFTGTLGPVATGFRLDTITIADGLMTVTGHIK